MMSYSYDGFEAISSMVPGQRTGGGGDRRAGCR